MSPGPFRLTCGPERLAACRLPTTAEHPAWAERGSFVAITRTPDELSVICEEDLVPEGVRVEAGFRRLSVEGTLELSAIGILAALAASLAAARISVLAVSTFDTDHLLVRQGDLDRAVEALSRAGHVVRTPGEPA